MAEIKLTPCPLCKSKDVSLHFDRHAIYEDAWVECNKCGTRTPPRRRKVRRLERNPPDEIFFTRISEEWNKMDEFIHLLESAGIKITPYTVMLYSCDSHRGTSEENNLYDFLHADHGDVTDISRETFYATVTKASELHPYSKDRTRPETYSEYNQGWTDACDYILSRLETTKSADGKLMSAIQLDSLKQWLATIPFHDLSDGKGLCVVCFKEDFEKAIKQLFANLPNCSAKMLEETDGTKKG